MNGEAQSWSVLGASSSGGWSSCLANFEGDLGFDCDGLLDGDCGGALFSAGRPSFGLGGEAGFWAWRLIDGCSLVYVAG